MELAFWLAAGFVVYTYAGYPVLIYLCSLLRSPLHARTETTDWPTVCVVVAVHNEERRILAKMRNLREIDYPLGKLRILVVSDGSTDATNALLAAAPGIDWIAYPRRMGKAHAINMARSQLREDVVVFTDARQTLDTAAIRYLVAALMQPGIGAVSGELVHYAPGTQTAANIGLYWRYEKIIRRAESRFWSTIGATGALYAIRAADIPRLHPDTLLDDFEIPIATLRKGLRTVFESRALIYDELQSDSTGERRRKLRTLSGNFQSFARNPWLLLPWGHRVWWQFMSHKVFRLLVPYALVLALVGSFAIGGAYRIFGFAQLLAYLLGVAALRTSALRRNRLLGLLVLFMELNWTAALAAKVYLGGRLDARWEKT